jgi:hypothetical protein
MFTPLSPSASKGAAMNTFSETTSLNGQHSGEFSGRLNGQFGGQPFFSQGGRKGIAYDWQSLYVSAEAAAIDREFATITAVHAE